MVNQIVISTNKCKRNIFESFHNRISKEKITFGPTARYSDDNTQIFFRYATEKVSSNDIKFVLLFEIMSNEIIE